MRFRALVVDTLRECKASSLFIGYAIFAAVVLLAEFIMTSTHVNMHFWLNGDQVSLRGEAGMGRLVIGGISVLLAHAFMLFALFGMSDLMTPVLAKGTAEVYLSKPVPRWLLLLARAAGHWLALASALVLTEAAAWLLVGVRTGEWPLRFFLSIPLILTVIVIYLALLAFFNLYLASPGLSALATFVVLLVTSVLRYYDALARIWPNPWWRETLVWSYRILPKGNQITDAVQGLVGGTGAVPWFALWTSLVFSAAALAAAAWVFERKDF